MSTASDAAGVSSWNSACCSSIGALWYNGCRWQGGFIPTVSLGRALEPLSLGLHQGHFTKSSLYSPSSSIRH
jgi:hypothetical protein